MQDTKMYRDFCALLVKNFNPRLHRLKVDCNRNILIIEVDVEEILGLRASGLDVPSLGGLVDLEAFVRIYDPKCEPLKVDAFEVCWSSCLLGMI